MSFHPQANVTAAPADFGYMVGGRVVQGGDVLTNGEVHFIKHVLRRGEWPTGTTEQEYEDSLRRAILDPRGGVLLDQRGSTWFVTFFARSGARRGPNGHGWIVVGFSTRAERWLTGFQPIGGVLYASRRPGRTRRRWLQPAR